MTVHINCHGDTHVGQKRPVNEDQFLIADLNKSMKVYQTSLGLNHQTRLMGDSQGKLFLVADGLGGHSSGERASSLAVDGVANYILNAMDWFLRMNEENEAELIEELKTAFIHSQDVLGEEADEIPQRRGMATTMTMAYVIWPNMYVVHVGDTRCYLLRDNEIRQITTDHNIDNLMKEYRKRAEEKGEPLDETLPFAPQGQALWNVIGGSDKSLKPQVEKVELAVGDRLMLCSDGLTAYVGEDELQKTISSDLSPEEACKFFIERANSLGGHDNITVVIAAIEYAEDPEGVKQDDTDELEGDFVVSQSK